MASCGLIHRACYAGQRRRRRRAQPRPGEANRGGAGASTPSHLLVALHAPSEETSRGGRGRAAQTFVTAIEYTVEFVVAEGGAPAGGGEPSSWQTSHYRSEGCMVDP
jgi:hypothetical protein